MTKLESLNQIIQSMSGNGDGAVAGDICGIVNEYSYCCGIKCEDCPFNSATNIDELALEFDSAIDE